MTPSAPFTIVRGFASETSVGELRDAIDWQHRDVVVYGKSHCQPRLTCWYGPVGYSYSGLAWPPRPMPGPVATIGRAVSGMLAINSVLCNLYRNGSDCVGWHADNEAVFGPSPGVVSVSFGCSRVFKIRENVTREVTSLELHHGDLLIMHPGMQATHMHQLPRTTKAVGERINLTFRMAHATH